MFNSRCLLACLLWSWSGREQSVICWAFSPRPNSNSNPRARTSQLFLAKARNKQLELAQKMKQAKAQREKNPKEEAVDDKPEDDEAQKQRSEFAQLLAKSTPPPAPKPETRSFISSHKATPQVPSGKTNKVKAKDLKKRKKNSIAAKNAEKKKRLKKELEDSQPLQEGDLAKRRDFEQLVSLESGRALGPIEAAQLVPWVPPYLSNYLVVLADPRKQSGDLRQAMSYLASNVSPEIIANVAVITPDSKEEITKWMKRADLEDTPIRILLDQKLDWMKRYSVLTDDDPRWSMSLLVLCTSGIIQKHIRQVEPSGVCQVTMSSIRSLANDV